MKKKVAISACLLGNRCRYDGSDNLDNKLLGKLEAYELIPFCPEDFAFGTPRPTMDLIDTDDGIKAISNLTKADLSQPVTDYAKRFFDENPDIYFLIGKDRSPSCGVCTAKIYNRDKELIDANSDGLMVQEAKRRGIKCYSAEDFIEKNPSAPITGS